MNRAKTDCDANGGLVATHFDKWEGTGVPGRVGVIATCGDAYKGSALDSASVTDRYSLWKRRIMYFGNKEVKICFVTKQDTVRIWERATVFSKRAFRNCPKNNGTLSVWKGNPVEMHCFLRLGHGHVPPKQLTKPCKLPKKTFFRFTTIEIASLPTQANGTSPMSFGLFYLLRLFSPEEYERFLSYIFQHRQK